MPGAFEDITPVQQMVSSCTGALLTSTLVTPLDVVKIRLQAQKKAFTKGKCFIYCNGLMDLCVACTNGDQPNCWYKRPAHFNGFFDALFGIARNEGITSLWSGLPPTLVMAVPATVVYFTCYEQCRNWFGYKNGTNPNDWWKPIAAGGTARVFAVTVISPLEMVRTKMQSEQLKYSQILTAVKNTVREGGVRALYKGWVPTIWRDVPFSALYWFNYEALKSYLLRTTGSETMTFSHSFLSGAIAGTIAGVLTLPFDVIKTHRQIELGETMNKGNAAEVSSTYRLIVDLYKQEGIQALFTGFVPRVIKVAPACAIMISTYEYFKNFFKTRNQAAKAKVLSEPEYQDVT